MCSRTCRRRAPLSTVLKAFRKSTFRMTLECCLAWRCAQLRTVWTAASLPRETATPTCRGHRKDLASSLKAWHKHFPKPSQSFAYSNRPDVPQPDERQPRHSAVCRGLHVSGPLEGQWALQRYHAGSLAWRTASCPAGGGRRAAQGSQSSSRSPPSQRRQRRVVCCAAASRHLAPPRRGGRRTALGSISRSRQACKELQEATLARALARH